MGKSRRNRNKGGQRSDPISKPVKPPTDPELLALREKSILPVLKDLQSADPKSRSAAAGAIANIIQDTKCRKLLLREQIVHILLNETLTDASVESRAAGWSILQVLVAEEEADFCVHLYRLDILTAIQHAASRVTETLTLSSPGFTKMSKAEQNFIWSIVVSLSSISSAIAEAQDEALEAIVKTGPILRFLFTSIAVAFTPSSALNSALSCMMTLSEDNQVFAEAAIADSETNCYKQLTSFKMGDGMKSVLACGILHNVFTAMNWHDQNPGKDGACDAVLVPTISQTLKVAQTNPEAAEEDSSSPSDMIQIALEILASIGTALQGSFEKPGNDGSWEGFDDGKDAAMDAGNEEDEIEDLANQGDEAADDDEDDEMDQDELEADMEMVTAADDYPDDEVSGIDDLPTLKELLQRAIPEIIKIAQDDGQSETTMVLRGHALGALNNIAWTLACLDFNDGQNAPILQAWAPVARSIWTQIVCATLASDTSDVELATMVTSLAWAITRALHHSEKDANYLGGNEQKKFISLYHASRNLEQDGEDPFQSLGVKCVGVLGQMALDPAPTQLNREIGVFLITVVAGLPSTPAADCVEALNQLFDAYGDENKPCDREVFWKENFLQHFEGMIPKVKAMTKAVDKRKSAELRSRAEQATLNLTRFVQYKQKHRPKE